MRQGLPVAAIDQGTGLEDRPGSGASESARSEWR